MRARCCNGCGARAAAPRRDQRRNVTCGARRWRQAFASTTVVVALALTAAGPALADRAAAEGAPEAARGVTLDSIDRADDVAGRAEPTLAAKVGEGPRRVTRKERLAQLADLRGELYDAEVGLGRANTTLAAQDQTNVAVLRAELEVERALRRLMEYDVREARERAALAQGLCSGAMLPP